MPKAFVGVRLPPELIVEAKAAAEEEQRSLSNYILSVISQDIERRKRAAQDRTQEEPSPYAKPKRKRRGS